MSFVFPACLVNTFVFKLRVRVILIVSIWHFLEFLSEKTFIITWFQCNYVLGPHHTYEIFLLSLIDHIDFLILIDIHRRTAVKSAVAGRDQATFPALATYVPTFSTCRLYFVLDKPPTIYEIGEIDLPTDHRTMKGMDR